MLAALTVALLASTALANWDQGHHWKGKTHTVKVGGDQLQYWPPTVKANVGDKIKFVFLQKNHTATQSSFEEPCRPLLDRFSKPVGFDSGFQPSDGVNHLPTYTVEVKNEKPIWVYCRQRGAGPKTHCQSGMVFAVNAPDHGDKTFDAYKKRALYSTAQNQASWSVSIPAPTQTAGGWHKGGDDKPKGWWDDKQGGKYTSHEGSGSEDYDDDSYDPKDDWKGDDWKDDGDNKWNYPPTHTSGGSEPHSTWTPPTETYPPPAAKTHWIEVGGLKDGKPDLTFKPSYINAAVGDFVQFKFGVANHTATVSSFADPCKRDPVEFDSGFMPVNANVSITLVSGFTVKDTKPIWMYCRQPGAGPKTHCQQGMVFAVNAPAQGNTFEKFLQNAAASTSQNAPSSGAPAPPAGKLSALGALGGDDESSNVDKLVSYAPVVLGLLGGAVGLGLVLVIMTAMLLVKSRRGGDNGRSFSPAYKPIIAGKTAEKPLQHEETYEYSTPSGRYSDN